MTETLVERFLKRNRHYPIYVNEAFERAFYLSKIERPKRSIHLNDNIQNISHDSIVANIEKIIDNKEAKDGNN